MDLQRVTNLRGADTALPLGLASHVRGEKRWAGNSTSADVAYCQSKSCRLLGPTLHVAEGAVPGQVSILVSSGQMYGRKYPWSAQFIDMETGSILWSSSSFGCAWRVGLGW